MKKYKLNKSLAWQEVRNHDLVYILNLDSGRFLYLNESGNYLKSYTFACQMAEVRHYKNKQR